MSEKVEKKSAEPQKDIIVVAEDSPPNRTILVHLLKKLGFDVIECADGELAYKELESAHNKKLPVVAVLSDIMMPKMDGVQLLKKVREHATLKDLPFVLITAVAEKEYIVQAKSMNVNGYVLKPVTFQRVLSKLTELFPQKTFPKLAG